RTNAVTTTASTNPADVYNYPVTLPVLDAFLSDSTFVSRVKANAVLNDSDISKLRALAHEAAKAEMGSDTGSTYTARTEAATKVKAAIGDDKTTRLFAFTRLYWSGGG